MLSHIDVLEEIEAVCVVDSEKNPVWSSNEEYPVIDESLEMEYLSQTDDRDISVLIPEGEDQVFTIKDGGIVTNKDAVEDIFNSENYDPSAPFTRLKLWMIVPINDMEVMVLNDVPIYLQDFTMMITCIVLCSLLIGAFTLHHLISIITMLPSSFFFPIIFNFFVGASLD